VEDAAAKVHHEEVIKDIKEENNKDAEATKKKAEEKPSGTVKSNLSQAKKKTHATKKSAHKSSKHVPKKKQAAKSNQAVKLNRAESDKIDKLDEDSVDAELKSSEKELRSLQKKNGPAKAKPQSLASKETKGTHKNEGQE